MFYKPFRSISQYENYFKKGFSEMYSPKYYFILRYARKKTLLNGCK